MDHSYVLGRAWRILWRYKGLALLGGLALAGLGLFTRLVDLFNYRFLALHLPAEAQAGVAAFTASPYSIVVVLLLLLLAGAVAVGISLVAAGARGVLVEQVRDVEEGRRFNWRNAWQAGRRLAPGVFVLRLLLGLPLIAATLMGAAPTLLNLVATLVEAHSTQSGSGETFTILAGVTSCLVPLSCGLVLLWVPLEVLERLAVRAHVLEGLPAGRALRRGWQVLRTNPGPVALLEAFVLALALAVVLLVGLLLGGVLLLLTLPTAVAVMISPWLYLGLNLSAGLLIWAGIVVGFGPLETYVSTAWTLAYRELAGLGLVGTPALPAEFAVGNAVFTEQ